MKPGESRQVATLADPNDYWELAVPDEVVLKAVTCRLARKIADHRDCHPSRYAVFNGFPERRGWLVRYLIENSYPVHKLVVGQSLPVVGLLVRIGDSPYFVPAQNRADLLAHLFEQIVEGKHPKVPFLRGLFRQLFPLASIPV